MKRKKEGAAMVFQKTAKYSLALLCIAGTLHAEVLFKSRLKNYFDPNKSDFLILDESVFGQVRDYEPVEQKSTCGDIPKCGVGIHTDYLLTTPPFDIPQALFTNNYHHGSFAIINPELYDPNNILASLASTVINVGLDEKLLAETTMSFDAKGLQDNPYGLKDDSILLAFAGPVITTTSFSQNVCFFIGKYAIYAFNDTAGSPTTRGWISFKKVADRKPDQIHKLGTEYDRKNNVLNWYVDDKLVATWDKIGFPAFADYHGQEPSVTNPGVPNLEFFNPDAKPGFTPREELGQWAFALLGPGHNLAVSQVPGGKGQVALGGVGAYTWPKSWMFEDPKVIANNQWKLFRNVPEKYHEKCTTDDADSYKVTKKKLPGKSATAFIYKVKISVDKVK